MKDTGTVIIIIHRFDVCRHATERVYVHYDSELCARMIKHLMQTSPGKEPAIYYFEDSRFIPLKDIERFQKWVEPPMT